jgi:hypothetical protein
VYLGSLWYGFDNLRRARKLTEKEEACDEGTRKE